jgi:hypothetical protein
MIPVTLQRKTFRLVLVVALLGLTAGCSGINASHSISPASFFLPGLLKADPPPAAIDLTPLETPAAKQVALLR